MLATHVNPLKYLILTHKKSNYQKCLPLSIFKSIEATLSIQAKRYNHIFYF